MKHLKIIVFLMVCILLSSFSFTPAHAEEPAGYCDVTFYLEDNTGGAFDNDITVTLSAMFSNKNYSFVLTKDNSYGNALTYDAGSILPAIYIIDINFKNMSRYTIKNFNDTEIFMMPSVEGQYNFRWKIDSIGIDESAKDIVASFSVDDSVGEGHRLFNDFITAMVHTINNPKWDGFYLYLTPSVEVHIKNYITHCGGTAEEWRVKSDFEKFVYYETYIRVMDILSTGSYNSFFGTENNFLNNVIHTMLHGLKSFGDGTEAEAYKALMLWQYHNLVENGSIYDFVADNESPFLDRNELVSQSIDQEQQELKTFINDVAEALAVDTTDAPGIWDNTISVFKKTSTVVMIIILAVLTSCLAIVVYNRKYKGIKNFDSDYIR